MPKRLLECLQAELIAQELGRDPATAGSDLPPIWIMPKRGAIGPGQERAPYAHPELVMSLFMSGGLPTAPYEGFWDAGRIIDVRIRTTNAPAALDLELELHELIGDRQNYDLGGLHVEESQRYLPLQLLQSSKDLGYDFVVRFMFWVRIASYLSA